MGMKEKNVYFWRRGSNLFRGR